MKYLIALFVVVNGSLAFADTKALEKCVAAYALTAVEEYNNPNESVISVSPEAKESAYQVIASMMKPQYAEEARKAFADAQSMGLIIQYGDEIHLLYVGVSIVGGQCQVSYGQSLNTADMTGEYTGFKPADVAKFFLNYSKQDMVKLLGPDFAEIYEIVEERLADDQF